MLFRSFHVNDADGNLAHLPEGMDITEACMLSDMVPTGFHGAELADVQFGDTVLVVGIGPVGLMAVAGAALRGAARILAVGTRPVCVEAARKYGATDFISYKNGPIDEQVLALTGGKGVDCAIIAGGDVDTFIPVVRVLKPGGRLLAGLDNGFNYAFDEDETKIINTLPFNPLEDEDQMRQLQKDDSGIQFSHTAHEQLTGQLKAGLQLLDLYEDTNGYGNLHAHNIPTYWATLARKA